MSQSLSTLLAVSTLLAACTEDDPPGDRFVVFALPDTQVYAEDFPAIFDMQTGYIAHYRDERDVRFVTHLGDIVDNGPDVEQWENARASLDLLDDAHVAYGLCQGNHDNMYGYGAGVDSSCSEYANLDCTYEHFLDYAGPDRMEHVPGFGGVSPRGISSWSSFEAGGYEFLFLHLGVDTRADEVAWAQSVLDDHPGALVHVSTHRYLYDYRIADILPDPLPLLAGGHYNALLYMAGDQALYYTDGVQADTLFEDFVAANPNIYMVQCGHVDAEFRQQSVNSAGLPVHEILTDFQSFHDDGGNGWMKELTYDLEGGTIEVRTFSPWLMDYRDNGAGFETSLSVLTDYFDYFADDLEAFGLDRDELESELEYYTTTEQGREEYYEALYGDGHRDSEFVLEVDFAAYSAAGR